MTLLWLYTLICAFFAGFMVCAAIHERITRPLEWLMILGLCIFWPYTVFLICQRELGR